MPAEAVEITVDDRERGSRVVSALEALGARVLIERLEVGDYAVGRIWGFERKSVDDLLSSIVNKRLFEQLRYLKRAYQHPILVVEGSIARVLKRRRFLPSQVYGAILAAIEMGVSVVFTEDYHHTAMLIYTAAKRVKRATAKAYVPPSKIRVVKASASLPIVQLNLLSSLPGISGELAHRILVYFKTPRRFFKATPAELRRVPGLGDKRVRKIIEVLDTMYQPPIDEQLALKGSEGGEIEGEGERRGHQR